MSQSFLDIIRKQLGDDYAGDQYGGARGSDGSGAPADLPGNFMFASGIECSNPTIQGGTLRRDELAECGHYDCWRQDFGLVREIGLKYLRYGLPIHKIFLGPGRYDWSFADEVMNELRRLDIAPILDLLHFGVPDWIGNFQNPELPLHFAEYAGAVAKRYPWVRWFTPVNEIFVTARNSGKDGLWNEQLRTDDGFVTALKHAVAANILACQTIVSEKPNAIFVQSETAEYTHDARVPPSPETALWNKLRFLSLDLLYAHVPDADVGLYMMDHGLTRDEYRWFMAGEPPGHQVMGSDYYGRNERIIKPDGGRCSAEDVLGWHQIARSYWQRYHKPVFHTETNTFDPDQAECWLWKQWINVLRLREEGVPVLGFTWYSLTDQVDWDTQLAEQNGHVNACGLYDLERAPRPVAAAYRELIHAYGRISAVPHGELFEVTDQPARLKGER